MPTPWAMRLDVIYGLILTATQSQIQEKGHNRLASWLIPENINQAVARVYRILSFNTKKWPHTTQHPPEKTSLNKHGFWWWTSKKCWLIRPIFLIKLVYGMWSWLKHKNVFRKKLTIFVHSDQFNWVNWITLYTCVPPNLYISVPPTMLLICRHIDFYCMEKDL